MKEMEGVKLELADIHFEFIITSREYKVIDKIIDKLNNDYNLIIFYPPNRIKSGILRILQSEKLKKNLNNIDIYTIQMYFNDVEKIPLPNDLVDNIILSLKYFSNG